MSDEPSAETVSNARLEESRDYWMERCTHFENVASKTWGDLSVARQERDELQDRLDDALDRVSALMVNVFTGPGHTRMLNANIDGQPVTLDVPHGYTDLGAALSRALRAEQERDAAWAAVAALKLSLEAETKYSAALADQLYDLNKGERE